MQKICQKYIEAFGAIASADNQKVILLPMEASALVGSLGGIGEISKEIFGGGQGPSGAEAPSQKTPSSTRSRSSTKMSKSDGPWDKV